MNSGKDISKAATSTMTADKQFMWVGGYNYNYN